MIFSAILLTAAGQTTEEFNGPFPSWANARTRFGAGARPGQDDTKALQAAIDSLSLFQAPVFNSVGPSKYIVIYLPAGIYKISGTLHLTGKIGCSIVGEDPEKTIVEWHGADLDTMLVANGSSYFKISRLTWDGGGHKGVEAIGLHWLDKNGIRFASTSIEFSDMVFKNLAYGIFGGTLASDGTGANDAEVTIKRCRFYECAQAGISIKGYNALDYWIWNCSFYDCGRVVQSHLGNYHIYGSVALRSKICDFDNNGPYYSSVRNCYSSMSQLFSYDEGSSSNPFKRIFENNLVELGRDIPIRDYDLGKLTLFNNVFTRSKAKKSATIEYGGWYHSIYQVLSIGNYYEDSVYVNYRRDHPFKLFSVDDKNAFRKIPATFSKLKESEFLPFVSRKVFEVKEGMGTKDIQQFVNQASALKGAKPVIHFGTGIYYFDGTVIVPKGTDIQFIGDGLFAATMLRRTGTKKNFPLFTISGSSEVSFKEFCIQSEFIPNTPAFFFTNFDQLKGEVHLDQIYTDATTTLSLENIDFTYFQKDNSFHSTGTVFSGGKRMLSGIGTAALYCFGGQSAKAVLQNNAVMVVKDCWWEGPGKRQFLPVDLTGSGRFSLQGAMIAPADLDSTVTLRVNGFNGNVTLSDLYVWGGIGVSGDKHTNVFVWNVHLMKKQDAFQFVHANDQYKLGMAGITTECSKAQSATCMDPGITGQPDKFVNITDTLGFMKNMTADLRSAIPRPCRQLPRGINNVLIYRVAVSGGAMAFQFKQD